MMCPLSSVRSRLALGVAIVQDDVVEVRAPNPADLTSAVSLVSLYLETLSSQAVRTTQP